MGNRKDVLMRWLLILFALPLEAQITCSPSNCIATAGGTVTLTSGTSVAWSLGSGSVGSLSTAGPSTSTIYTAPTGVVAQDSMLGCPVQPNDSIFTLRVDGLPLDPNSSTKIGTLEQTDSGSFTAVMNFQPSWGISRANSSTPTRNFKTYYGSLSTTAPQPTNAALFRESGNQNGIWGYSAIGNSGVAADHHQMIVNYSTCAFTETYDDNLSGSTTTCQDSTTGCNVRSLASYNGPGYAEIVQGTDAAGLPLAPLTLTDLDMQLAAAGVPIGHKLRFTEAGSNWVGFRPSDGASIFLWPATANANSCIFSIHNCTPAPTFDPTSGQSTNYASLGNIFRLKASFATTGLCNADSGSPSPDCSVAGICVSPLTSRQITMCQNFFTGAMQQGGIPADTGSDFAFTVSNDLTDDPDAMAVLNQIHAAGISRSNWEIVDTLGDGLFYKPGSYQTTPNGTAGTTTTVGGITYPGAIQSNVTPATQAVVIGGSNSVSIVVQPVGIGTSLPQFVSFIEAGSYSIPMASYFWVVPSTVGQSITWSVIGSGCGSFSGSTYSPPATASSAVLGCDLHGVSVTDSAAVIDIFFNLFPSGSAVRMDTGSATTTTDGLSNTWQADTLPIGSQSTSSGISGSWGGNWATQFNTQVYNYADDITYSGFVNPASNYQLHLLMGQAYSTPGTWPTASGVGRQFSSLAWNPVNVEVSGSTWAHGWNWPYLNGFLYNNAAGGDILLPGTTDTNGYITISVRTLVPDTAYSDGAGFVVTSPYSGPNLAPPYGSRYNLFSGFELTQDSTPAFMSIDLAGGSQPSGCRIQSSGLLCAESTSLQPIYSVPWYISGFSRAATVWTIQSDPFSSHHSTITTNPDGSGSLAIGMGATGAGQPLIVKATNGSYSATTVITIAGSKYILAAQ